MLRKIISYLLAISMIFNVSVIAFAQTNNNYRSDVYTTDQYGNRIYTEILEELTDESARIFSSNSKASATMDQYITINNHNLQNGNYSPTISYTVKTPIPSGVTCYIGYEYPASYGKVGLMIATSRSKGTYTINLGNINLIGKYNFKAKFIARDYTEYKEIKNVTYYPMSTTTQYKEVTAAEGITSLLLGYIPGAIVTFYPSTQLIKLAASTVSGWNFVTDLSQAGGVPLIYKPVAKNYIKTVTTYDSSGLTISITIYKNKSSSSIEHTSIARYNYK